MNRQDKFSRGLVLINALLVVAALSAVAVLLLQTAQNARIRQHFLGEQAQLHSYLNGFEVLMRLMLDQDRRANNVDHLREPWAQENYQVEIDRGQVTGTTRDLQGLFNLNWLSGGDGLANGDAFLQLVRARGLPESLGQNILDWLDRDAPPNQSWYLSRNPALAPRGGAIGLLDELRQVEGMNTARFAKLAPLLTAIPAEGAVNINTAPRAVLEAVLSGIPPGKIGAILLQRKTKPFETEEDLAIYLQSIFSDEEMVKFGNGVLGVSSQWFETRFSATLGPMIQRRVVVFHRSAQTGKTLVKLRFIGKD